jgi:hypothetical protein
MSYGAGVHALWGRHRREWLRLYAYGTPPEAQHAEILDSAV